MLSTLNPPAGVASAQQLVDTAIANAVFAARATVHSALQTTPGGLAFGRDMVLDIPLIADLELIRQKRQQLIDNRLIAANRQRFSYDYSIGDEVLKLVYKPNKLEPRATGPYTIQQVHTNGTLTIRLSPTVIERISIRRVKPYRRYRGFHPTSQGSLFVLSPSALPKEFILERQNVVSYKGLLARLD